MINFPKLKISENRRFIVKEDNTPFFWLGDTAWELFHRLNIEDMDLYLKNRRDKKFSIIQVVALAELDGITTPNAYGDKPLIDEDPTKPNEPYWKFVDAVISKAAEYGLYIGLLPTWGDKVADLWGSGPVIFDDDNAYIYGRWIANRYKEFHNIVWILGGDRPAVYQGLKSRTFKNDIPIWRAMALGIKSEFGSPTIITYHPSGGHSSSEYIHNEDWLDLNMIQSGHGSGHDVEVWSKIEGDYKLDPIKPTLDGEPNYEDHPVNPWPEWNPSNGYFDDYDVRKQLYRSVFAGGAGVTYGHHSVWQMCSDVSKAINHAKMDWKTALDRPGANQVQYLRRLIESRPYLTRIPDQSIVKVGYSEKSKLPVASRDELGRYCFIYLPVDDSIVVDMAKMESGQVNAWWFNPENGKSIHDGKYSGGVSQIFSPPTGRRDWVLVLDSVDYNTPPPGEV